MSRYSKTVPIMFKIVNRDFRTKNKWDDCQPPGAPLVCALSYLKWPPLFQSHVTSCRDLRDFARLNAKVFGAAVYKGWTGRSYVGAFNTCYLPLFPQSQKTPQQVACEIHVITYDKNPTVSKSFLCVSSLHPFHNLRFYHLLEYSRSSTSYPLVFVVACVYSKRYAFSTHFCSFSVPSS